MQHREGNFISASKIVRSYLDSTPAPAPLFCQSWFPSKSKPRGVIALVHGVGEHSSRYAHVAQYFVQAGYALMTFDLPGHGRSPGLRGHIKCFDDFREDTAAFLQVVKERAQGKAIFLLGHSFGGLIATDYVLHNPDRTELAGLVLSAPALAPALVPAYLWWIAKTLSKIPVLGERLQISTKLDPNKMSRDSKEVDKYVNDPLVHGLATPRFGMEYERTRQQVVANEKKLDLPLLVVHGEADGVNPVEGSREIMKNSPAQLDKTIKTYPGAYHELFNEIPETRAEALGEVLRWIQAHTPQT